MVHDYVMLNFDGDLESGFRWNSIIRCDKKRPKITFTKENNIKEENLFFFIQELEEQGWDVFSIGKSMAILWSPKQYK
jgi:hypothetical protein